jgi:hypothetical protein
MHPRCFGIMLSVELCFSKFEVINGVNV